MNNVLRYRAHWIIIWRRRLNHIRRRHLVSKKANITQVAIPSHFVHQRLVSVLNKSRFRRRPYRGFREVGETGYPKNGLNGEWTAGTDVSNCIGGRARGREFEGPGSGVWSWGRDCSEEGNERLRRNLDGSCSKKGSCKALDAGSEPPKSGKSVSACKDL